MRFRLLALALFIAACSSQPTYQGNVIVGNFDFTATVIQDSCGLILDGGSTSFIFDGVVSYDSTSQVLFFDGDGDPSDDHVGTLKVNQFVLNNPVVDGGVKGALRICSGDVDVTETFQGSFYGSTFGDAGCAALTGGDGDGGAFNPGTPTDFTTSSSQPMLACGTLTDQFGTGPAIDGGFPDGGLTCGPCTLVYSISGVNSGVSQ